MQHWSKSHLALKHSNASYKSLLLPGSILHWLLQFPHSTLPHAKNTNSHLQDNLEIQRDILRSSISCILNDSQEEKRASTGCQSTHGLTDYTGLLLFLLLLLFGLEQFQRVSLCSHGWPRTLYIDQAGLILTEMHLPCLPSDGIKGVYCFEPCHKLLCFFFS